MWLFVPPQPQISFNTFVSFLSLFPKLVYLVFQVDESTTLRVALCSMRILLSIQTQCGGWCAAGLAWNPVKCPSGIFITGVVP